MKTFLAVVRDIALLLARLALGGVLVMQGWRGWVRDGIQARINEFIDLGMPQPEIFAWAFTIMQLVCGVLLIVGLFTPIAGALVLAASVILIVFGQFEHGLWVDHGGYEYSLVTAALALIFLCFGGGRAALDMLLRRDPEPSDDVFVVDDNALA